jgi:hypothetical protein
LARPADSEGDRCGRHRHSLTRAGTTIVLLIGDLLFANRGPGNGLQLLRSVGQGFVDETALRVTMLGPLACAPPVAVVDFDGDGDQDVVARFGVVRNRARDLQIAATPRLGQPGELVLHAHAGDGLNAQVAWLFMADALGPPLPLPGLGTLALDPASMQQVALRTLPAAGGEASYSFVVPAQPSLLVAQVFAQALFAHRPAVSSWRLGNWVRLAVRV